MFGVVQLFGKRCSCHLKGEYVLLGVLFLVRNGQGNYNVCRNVERLSTFDASYTRMLRFYNELKQGKPTNSDRSFDSRH